MRKHIRFAALALLGATVLTSCLKDEEPEPIIQDADLHPETGILLVNQGSMYSGIDGTLSLLDLTTGGLTNGIFRATNGQSLGDSPQNAIAYGSKVYVSVFGSNLVWVLDRRTLQIVKKVETNSPEWVAGANGYVYVANNDGYVSKIDTTALAITDRLAVGPNPACLLADATYLYVSISDGYNSDGGYANGKRVARIRLSDFTPADAIPVGLNPGRLVQGTDGGPIFVVCQGNWADIAPAVWKVSGNEAHEFCPGSMAAANAGQLYVINSVTDWSTYTTTTDYKVYDTTTGEVKNDNFIGGTEPESPTFIAAKKGSTDIYIGSRASGYDYTSPGYLYVFGNEGTLRKKYDVGIEPYSLVFF
ncbi:MAG: hypothetical protein IJ729_08765 [Alloprevotella sp.]|nr:hypothetical protein [Alloprevotella sp.]